MDPVLRTQNGLPLRQATCCTRSPDALSCLMRLNIR